MKIKSLSINFAAFLALSFGVVHAATVVYSTDFNSPLYANGGLIGQDGWIITNTSVVSPISVAGVETNGTVTLATTGQDVRRLFTPATTSDSVFLKADISVASANATGDYFIHLGDGGTSNFYARTFIKATGSGFSIAVGTSTGAAVNYGAGLAFNTTYSLLIRYDIVSGAANDTGAVFINPAFVEGVGDTPYVALTNVGTDATSISSLSLRQGATGPVVTVDNIVISGVPEPTGAILGAVGLLTLARRRR